MLYSTSNMLKLYKYLIIKHITKRLIILHGCNIPTYVKSGSNVNILHNGVGTVIHRNTTIEDDVTILHSITIG